MNWSQYLTKCDGMSDPYLPKRCKIFSSSRLAWNLLLDLLPATIFIKSPADLKDVYTRTKKDRKIQTTESLDIDVRLEL